MAEKAEVVIADFIQNFFLDEKKLDKLIDLVIEEYKKEHQNDKDELSALMAQKHSIEQKIKNFYSFIESIGSIDDMQTERYQSLKNELESVKALIIKAKKEAPNNGAIDKAFVKSFVLAHSSVKTPEELEKLAPFFVDNIIVKENEFQVTFKLEHGGAPGGNRTHAFSSGG